MKRRIKQMPFEAYIVVPLRPVAEFTPHEQQLLTGMPEHVPVEQPQVCEFPPVVAGHPAQHGTLAVDNLVMRKQQNKVLAERIQQAKSNLIVVVASINGILGHVAEHVVHPAHVPLEAESEAPQVNRP